MISGIRRAGHAGERKLDELLHGHTVIASIIICTHCILWSNLSSAISRFRD